MSRLLKRIENRKKESISPENIKKGAYIYNAVTKKELSKLENLLGYNGPGWNFKNKDGMSPLLLAARDGSVEILSELLFHQKKINGVTNLIDINQSNNGGNTPLLFTVSNEYIDCVKLLLAYPTIDVNKKNNFGNSPLIISAQNENILILNLLLQNKKILVNELNIEGDNALLVSVKKNLKKNVELLLENGGDFLVKNKKGENFMTYNNESSYIVRDYIFKIMYDYNSFKKYFKDSHEKTGVARVLFYHNFIEKIIQNNQEFKTFLTKDYFKKCINYFKSTYLSSNKNKTILINYLEFIEVLYKYLYSNKNAKIIKNNINELKENIYSNYPELRISNFNSEPERTYNPSYQKQTPERTPEVLIRKDMYKKPVKAKTYAFDQTKYSSFDNYKYNKQKADYRGISVNKIIKLANSYSKFKYPENRSSAKAELLRSLTRRNIKDYSEYIKHKISLGSRSGIYG